MKGRYEGIINMPHHVSSERRHMEPLARAAQFAPFAALSGFEGAIAESARLTGRMIELDSDEIERLDRKLCELKRRDFSYQVSIEYFKPDERKEGGAYVVALGYVKSIDLIEGVIFMTDSTKIPIELIINVEELENESEERREKATDI